MWMCDVMSSCFMLISRSEGVPPVNKPSLKCAATGTPSHLYPYKISDSV